MTQANQSTQQPATKSLPSSIIDIPNHLPTTGFIRQSRLLGQAPISAEQAEQNRQTGKGPKRPRPGCPAILPWSPNTLWRKVKTGEFVAPVKLSDGITAWPVEAVRAWLQSKQQA